MISISGVLNINKPAGVTSSEYMNYIKNKFEIKKIGYAGTIDKFAEGVLPLLLNKATRLAQWIDLSKKVYMAKIKLGIETDTNDITGEVINEDKNFKLDIAELLITLQKFIGEQEQIPPIFSAKKIKGKRASDLVREGKEVKLKPNLITIYNIEVESVQEKENIIELKISCSKGTFIRAFARDLGIRLGTYGTVIELTRIKNGIFEIKDSIDKDVIEKVSDISELNIISMSDALSYYPKLHLISSYKNIIFNGKFLNKFYFHNYEDIKKEGIYRVVDSENRLLALIELSKDNKFKYLRVFK